jgi:hypothetical protein
MNHSIIYRGFQKGAATLGNGETANAITVKPVGAALTPAHPIRFVIKKLGSAQLQVLDILHEKGEDKWLPVPRGY